MECKAPGAVTSGEELFEDQQGSSSHHISTIESLKESIAQPMGHLIAQNVADYDENFTSSGSAEKTNEADSIQKASPGIKKRVSWDEGVERSDPSTLKGVSTDQVDSFPVEHGSEEDRVNQPDITLPDVGAESEELEEPLAAEEEPPIFHRLEQDIHMEDTSVESSSGTKISATHIHENESQISWRHTILSNNAYSFPKSSSSLSQPHIQAADDDNHLESGNTMQNSSRSHSSESYIDEETAMLDRAGVLVAASPKPLLYSRPIVLQNPPSEKELAVSKLKAKIKERAKAKEMINNNKKLPSSPFKVLRRRPNERPRSVLLSTSGKTFLNTPAPVGAARPNGRYLQDYDTEESADALHVKKVASPSRNLLQPTRASLRQSTAAPHKRSINYYEQTRTSEERALNKSDNAFAEEGSDNVPLTSAAIGSIRSFVTRDECTMTELNARDAQSDAFDIAQREQEMLNLKAQLFTLQNSLHNHQANTRISVSNASPHPEDVNDSSIGLRFEEENNEPVILSKEAYQKLRREIDTLDKLVDGYQKENEKMLITMKEIRSQEAQWKAKFFDEREELNRELNMYRNAAPQGPNITRKSAELLKEELEKDALVRNLRERVAEAESGAGTREKELLQTVDRLRDENKQLAVEIKRITLDFQKNETTALSAAKEELRKIKDEAENLRNKLIWYAENQEIIDNGEQERQDLSHDLSVCKRELKALGVDLSSLDLRIRGNMKAAQLVPEESISSALTAVKKSPVVSKPLKINRNPADIKRIKELESLVKDLKEAIVKRHPDSLSALIQAANASDSTQLDRKAKENELSALKEELVRVKEASEKKIRALRQEHEKIKLNYEQKNNAGGVGIDTSSTNRLPRTKAPITNIKSLPKALERIRFAR